jgi:hypothetical protein
MQKPPYIKNVISSAIQTLRRIPDSTLPRMYKKTAKIFAKFSPLATAVRALTASLRCNCALDLRRIPLLTLIIVTFSALCCVCLLVFFFDEFHFLPSFDLIDAVKLFVTAFMPMFFLLISAMA